MSLIFSNAEWIASSDLTLLGSAYESTRIALQREAGLTDADLDTLTDVMGDALLSLYRAGQVNETRLTNYAVAKTLRHISAGQRCGIHGGPHDRRRNTDPLPSAEKRLQSTNGFCQLPRRTFAFPLSPSTPDLIRLVACDDAGLPVSD